MNQSKNLQFSADLHDSSEQILEQVENRLLKKIMAGVIQEKDCISAITRGERRFGEFGDFGEFPAFCF